MLTKNIFGASSGYDSINAASKFSSIRKIVKITHKEAVRVIIIGRVAEFGLNMLFTARRSGRDRMCSRFKIKSSRVANKKDTRIRPLISAIK